MVVIKYYKYKILDYYYLKNKIIKIGETNYSRNNL